MALDEILAAIERETERSVESVLQDARDRVAAADRSAGARADEERRRMSHSRDEAAELAAARTVNQARLAADRALRQAQEELFAGALREVRRRLVEVRSGPEYESLFDELLDEALQVLPDARTAVVDARDLDLAGRAVRRAGLDLEIDASLETWGGVELRSGDGRIVRNTLESRLDKADPALRRMAVSRCPELVVGV